MKKLMLVLGACALLSIFSTNVYAYYSHSGYHTSPEVYANKWTPESERTIFSLTSASAPVKGSEVSTMFKREGKLRSTSVTAHKGRKMTIMVCEDDKAPNEDEEIRSYEVEINEYQMPSTYKITSLEDGNIESASDKTAELYVKVYLQKFPGDTENSNGTMFDYDIRLD